ncbi:MAG: hypothetical protein WDM79_18080 [Terricaulis sp.]
MSPVLSRILGLALALCAATPAAAQTTPRADLAAVCAGFDDIQEAADQRTVEAAIAAFQRGGFAALRENLGALRAVLDHAPACYPAIERRGDDVIIRADDPSNVMILSTLLTAAVQGRATTVTTRPNTYPSASLILGSYASETGQYAEALVWLDRGLALQPLEQGLTLEKATALAALHRPAEAVAILQAVLDDPAQSLTLDRARFLRNLGIHLIDLNRLDDAEAALNQSIALQADNPIARSELEYIAQLRAGGARQNFQIIPLQPTPSPQK